MRRMVPTALSMLMLLTSPPARGDVAARKSPVEVVVPKPPTPVLGEGKEVLAYELHITNFGAVPLRLERIEIRGGALRAEFSGAELQTMLQLIGGKNGDEARLEPGRRLVAYVWLNAASGGAPESLRHRLVFGFPDATAEPKESAIDGMIVPVIRARPPVLSSPFTDGDWLATGPSNSAAHRRSVIAVGGRATIAQRFAIDWVLVGKNGNTFHDSRERNENFWSFGQSVHAVADGEVIEAIDTYDDNVPGHPPPVTVENIAGNHIIVRIAPSTYVLFGHLQHGSIRVRPHQRIRRGESIAAVGNSGNTTGPHLHLQLMDAASSLIAEGIPYVFDDFDFLGTASEFDEEHHSSKPRRAEIPLGDVVIRFRSRQGK